MWKTSREELRLARRLFAPSSTSPGGRRGAADRAARRLPSRREVAELLRRSTPFEEESLAFLRAAGGPRARALAQEASKVLRRPATLRRTLKPVRPLSLEEIRAALNLDEGPRLGAALAAFDLALASHEVRGAAAARKWLAAFQPAKLKSPDRGHRSTWT